MKSGIKTTEFWMTVATQVGTLITALNGIIPPTLAIIISASATCAYTILRSLVKNPEITTLSVTK